VSRSPSPTTTPKTDASAPGSRTLDRPQGVNRGGNRKEQQAAEAKTAICAAVTECLDRHGYAETSINRIIDTAGISRGALTHHFPSKEALIVETAERLLSRIMDPKTTLRGRQKRNEGTEAEVAADLLYLWQRVVNTAEGRAWLEILNASRTDRALRQQIGDRLQQWNTMMNDQVGRQYRPTGTDDDVRTLWTICRIFMRGMLTHQSSAPEDDNLAVMNRFIDLLAPHMRRHTDPEAPR